MYEQEDNYEVFNARGQWQNSFRTFHDALNYIRANIREADWLDGCWRIEDEDGNELNYAL